MAVTPPITIHIAVPVNAPDEIVFNGRRVISHMTAREKEIYRYGATSALIAVADAWQEGQWTALTPTVKARNVLGAAQVVTDWLRAQVKP